VKWTTIDDYPEIGLLEEEDGEPEDQENQN